jgi:hypothetical protein
MYGFRERNKKRNEKTKITEKEGKIDANGE